MRQSKIPLACGLVPKHIRVAGLALERDYGIVWICGKRNATVRTQRHALHLAHISRSIHGHHSILSESGCVGLVHDTAAAEYHSESVGLYGHRLMLPIYEIGRFGMSPRQVLPFRTIRVVLVIEMPLAVFVEHSVGVVHPAVKRCMVIGRTVFLAIGGVESVHQPNAFPACVIFSLAHRAAALRCDNVENNVLAFVGRQVVRNGIVNLRFCQTHTYCLDNISVNKHIDTCIVVCLLNRKKQILALTRHTYQCVAYSEMVHLHARSLVGNRLR